MEYWNNGTLGKQQIPSLASFLHYSNIFYFITPSFRYSNTPNKLNYNPNFNPLKVNFHQILFQGFEMAGLIHERKNVLPIFILDQVNSRCILGDLPEVRVVQT